MGNDSGNMCDPDSIELQATSGGHTLCGHAPVAMHLCVPSKESDLILCGSVYMSTSNSGCILDFSDPEGLMDTDCDLDSMCSYRDMLVDM